MSVAQAAASFAGRDFRIARSYKIQFAMTIATTLISLVTFRFIAKLVGTSSALAEVPDYFAFVVIGLAIAQVMEGAITAPAGAVRQEQVQGTLEVLALSPMRPGSLAAGWITYPLLQSTLTGFVMLLAAVSMGLRFSAPNVGVALLVLVLAAMTFAALGIFCAAAVLLIQQAAGITRWMVSGLGLTSGVFFPVSLFPGWFQAIAAASPLTHALRALRGALLHGKGLSDLAGELAALSGAAAVLLPLSVLALGAALRRARSRGTIATY